MDTAASRRSRLVVDVAPDPLLTAEHVVAVLRGLVLEAGERRERALEALEDVQQTHVLGSARELVTARPDRACCG